ncbi:MAG: NUDIX domain-containing protein, partial [Actinomycetota bacterium]
MAGATFRAGVAMIVRRGDGQLLAFERRDSPGSWQLPQGGIDAGETPTDAAWRELHEETGLDINSVRLVGECPDWIS